MTKRKCKECGAEFNSDRNTSVRCPACQKERIRNLKNAARRRKAAEARKVAKAGTLCPYCGKPVLHGVYCNACVENGFDKVHEMFGSTNGWDTKDKKRTPRAHIKFGNRGVIPGGAINIGGERRYINFFSATIGGK